MCINRFFSSVLTYVMSFSMCIFIVSLTSSYLRLIISTLFYFSAVVVSSATNYIVNVSRVGTIFSPCLTPHPCFISLYSPPTFNTVSKSPCDFSTHLMNFGVAPIFFNSMDLTSRFTLSHAFIKSAKRINESTLCSFLACSMGFKEKILRHTPLPE